MSNSNHEIREILRENVAWWEQAAATCERIGDGERPDHKEELDLMCAVYRERAEIHSRLLKKLLGKKTQST